MNDNNQSFASSAANDDHTTADQPDGELDTAYKVAYTILRPHDVKMREVDNAKALIEALLRRHVLTARIDERTQPMPFTLEMDADNPSEEYEAGFKACYEQGKKMNADRLAALRDELAGLTGEK